MKKTILNTQEIASISPYINRLRVPKFRSHKGQNGKLLVIGGSSLFHSASIWAAEIASHFVDMVHYCSTSENAKILLALKTKFQNGMVIKQQDVLDYIKEDDVVLIGPGMMRGVLKDVPEENNFNKIIKYQNKDESGFTYLLTRYMLLFFPEKKFVLDAGALQMMDIRWLSYLKTKPILTPHVKEFKKLFGFELSDKSEEEKITIIQTAAKQYRCVLIVKSVDDFVSDGEEAVIIKGGNAGLTKGGSGDILAGMIGSFYTHMDALTSSILSSFVLKSTADRLFISKGTWYNNDDVINLIPEVLLHLKNNT